MLIKWLGWPVDIVVDPLYETLKYANCFHRGGQENLRPKWRVKAWLFQLTIYGAYHCIWITFSLSNRTVIPSNLLLLQSVHLFCFIHSKFLVSWYSMLWSLGYRKPRKAKKEIVVVNVHGKGHDLTLKEKIKCKKSEKCAHLDLQSLC